ncbi:YkgJ family cysteine cluster protein [Echinicola sediminis]
MNLLEKSLAVNEIFKELELEIKHYYRQTGLGCVQGCSHCCANPKIPATPLEFLPLAFHLYQSGRAEEFLEKLESTGEESYCVLLKQLSLDGRAGQCSAYSQRGMICRLFGNSARRNREDRKELITCKLIKSEKQELYDKVAAAIMENQVAIPVSSDYYTKLYAIDFHMAKEQYPVNIAIKKALEAVLSFYFYFEGQAI